MRRPTAFAWYRQGYPRYMSQPSNEPVKNVEELDEADVRDRVDKDPEGQRNREDAPENLEMPAPEKRRSDAE